MNITIIGLDIAKSVFHACGMNKAGKVLIKKRLYRSDVLSFFANTPRCIVAIESCGGSSYWAREVAKFGHEVRLVPAQYVKPYVKGQKNDLIDAEAIAEAALRPTMRFVSPNSVEQQDLQNVHRVRERLVKQRTALLNQIRGLLLEYGITIPQGGFRVAGELAEILHHPEHGERILWKQILSELREDLTILTTRVKHYDAIIRRISKENPLCQELEKIRGVGPTTSTAILAAVSNPSDFKNGRQFSAWLGLVPKQHSTGGKQKLLGITKKGDKYIRWLLVHGARMEVRFAEKHKNQWLLALKERRGYNKAAVALANKNARRIWATLSNSKIAA